MNKKIIPIFFSFLLIALFFVAPVQANDDITIVVKGGFGVNIAITNNLENDTIAYNFTILWKNICNKVLHTTNAQGIVLPHQTWNYKEAPIRLITRIHVHVESEGIVVEKTGIAFFVFVILW